MTFTMKQYLFICLCILQFIKGKDIPEICPEIISRTRWGARRAVQVDYATVPVKNVIVHHTVTPTCETEAKCSQLIKAIQNFHLEDMEFHDIGYNFLVGGDGKIYEGAGWHKVGAHTRGYNSKSLGLAFVGNFTDERPPKEQLTAAKHFLECGVQLGELSEDYKLFGARQVSATQSPGLKLYHEIQDWPNFSRKP